MRVLFLPRYSELGASSRLRFYQYVPGLRELGIEVTVAPLLGDEYVQGLYAGRIPKRAVLRSYFERVRKTRHLEGVDAIFLEKEFLPWLPRLLEQELLRDFPPTVVDYDDAVFHRYDRHASWPVRALLGRKLDDVMHRAQAVTVGNEYLADRARLAGANEITVLPTVVDVARYRIAERTRERPLTIGWIGSPATAHYLREVSPVLTELTRGRKVACVAVGARPDQVEGTPFVARNWTVETEVESIFEFDVGIMPLVDAPFERGKCGYKLIQYMASGIPVVASPIGVNRSIVRSGENGYLASDSQQWAEALERLLGDALTRETLGRRGRADVEAKYSLQSQLPRLEAVLRRAAQVPAERRVP